MLVDKEIPIPLQEIFRNFDKEVSKQEFTSFHMLYGGIKLVCCLSLVSKCVNSVSVCLLYGGGTFRGLNDGYHVGATREHGCGAEKARLKNQVESVKFLVHG